MRSRAAKDSSEEFLALTRAWPKLAPFARGGRPRDVRRLLPRLECVRNFWRSRVAFFPLHGFEPRRRGAAELCLGLQITTPSHDDRDPRLIRELEKRRYTCLMKPDDQARLGFTLYEKRFKSLRTLRSALRRSPIRRASA